MKKKVCMILTNAFEPDVRVYKEAVYLVSNGCQVEILCWDRDPSRGFKNREIIDGIKVIRFKRQSVAGTGYKQLGAYFGFVLDCMRYCRKRHFDYFHCNDFDGAVVWRFLRHGNSKMVFDMHEYYEDVGKGPEIERQIMRKATIYFIKKSKFALYENDLYLKKPYKRIQNRLLKLKNYPDSKLVKYKEKTQSEVFRVGYHGAVRVQIPEFTTLFEAVKDMPDVRVDVHGGGPDLPSLKRMQKRYKNVFVHGPFDGVKELTDLYAKTDIVYAGYRPYCNSKEYDEVVKYYECIITGTPIILTKGYTKMCNEIKHYGFGLVCDTLDVEEVKRTILKLKEDKEFWNCCHENELREALKYDWNNEVRILDVAYQL